MAISKNDPAPLHYQLKTDLRNSIKNGEWATGDLFPTDKELMQKYGLSSTTVRRAVSELAQEGWLVRGRGKGTFVRGEAVEESLGRLTGFFEEMALQGLRPSADILELAAVTLTPKEVANQPRLTVFGQSELYLIKKIQKIEHTPIVYVLSYWPYAYGTKIAEFDLTKEGIYQVVDRELKLVLTRAVQTISAGVASKEIAGFLGVSAGFPVMIMERVTYAGDEPVECSYNVYRSDQYKFKIELHHNQLGAVNIWGKNNA